MNIKIDRVSKLAANPDAVNVALQGFFDLVERGLNDPACLGVGYDWPALLATIADEPVGILVYAHEEWRASFRVELGYVSPQCRRKGVYRALWSELLKVARENRVMRILGITHVHNAEMRAVMEKLGRKQTWLTYEAWLAPEGNDDDGGTEQ